MTGLDTYRGVRVLVLGSTGFVGRWIARQLVRSGAQVETAVRDSEAARPILEAWEIPGEPRTVDLTDRGAAQRLIEEVAPAVVFNAAGYGVDPMERGPKARPELARDINSLLPGWLAEPLSRIPAPGWRGRRAVHLGSILEYGPIGGDLRETSVPRPDLLAARDRLYGESKLAGTLAFGEAAVTHGIDGLTARLCQVYGPGEHPKRILPQLVEAGRTGTQVPLSIGTQKKDWTTIMEVAHGVVLLALTRGDPGEVVNLASGVLTPLADFAEEAAAVIGLAPGQLAFTEPVPEGELVHDPVATRRLESLTGWRPTQPPRQGVAATLGFIRERGWPARPWNQLSPPQR